MPTKKGKVPVPAVSAGPSGSTWRGRCGTRGAPEGRLELGDLPSLFPTPARPAGLAPARGGGRLAAGDLAWNGGDDAGGDRRRRGRHDDADRADQPAPR